MWNEVARPYDRARHQLREERQEKDVVGPHAQRLDATAVDIGRVADRLEDEKRDAHRQEDVLEVEPVVSAQSVYDADKEVRVFEVDQQADVERDAQREQPFAQALPVASCDSFADQEVRDRYGYQQQEEKAAGLVVEVEREERDVDDAQHHLAAHELVEEGEPAEEEQEKPAAENQRRDRVVLQQLYDFIRYFTQFVHRSLFVQSF